MCNIAFALLVVIQSIFTSYNKRLAFCRTSSPSGASISCLDAACAERSFAISDSKEAFLQLIGKANK